MAGPELVSQPVSRKRLLSSTEARERVKRQARCAKDIIVLDDDDDEAVTDESDHERASDVVRFFPTPVTNNRADDIVT